MSILNIHRYKYGSITKQKYFKTAEANVIENNFCNASKKVYASKKF